MAKTLKPDVSGMALPGLSGRTPAPLSRDEESALKRGDEFRECAGCPPMVVVPPGSFTMGSPKGEPDRRDDEGPQHLVHFAKGFAVGKFAVTFAEWDACHAAGGCNDYGPSAEGWGRATRPVINVSYDDALAYADWLSKQTGQKYRLLTEAEREYVTRAGTSTPFWWGQAISPEQANYDGTYLYQGGGAKGVFREQSVPVDSFAANPWGLFGVHGNVWEWVQDCHHDSYAGAPVNGSAWKAKDCRRRVLRGGARFNVPDKLRSARRDWWNPDDRDNSIGFRLARSLLN